MITTVGLVNFHHWPSYTLFFLWWELLRIYSPSNFQIYSIWLLTIVIMLYITSPELIYLISGSLYLLTTFTHFPHPSPPPQATTNLFCFYEFSFFYILHMSEIIQYFFFWFIILSIMPSEFILVIENQNFLPFKKKLIGTTSYSPWTMILVQDISDIFDWRSTIVS